MDGFNTCLNTLKIGYKSYAIERPEEINEVRGSYYGTVDFSKSIIKIAGRFEQNDKNCTFIHEMLHCICERFDMNQLNADDFSISLLALGIYEAILDNPHMFKMADI